ncbi:hypothetical protein [Acidisoma silvae]|uniref:Uncharacterized protein n=1 Tax=Acidisoma silvae TaxID=2802396 RepID=A0A964DX48_9PROT|nr:hypothetical protein [Acidisoma silvae]MCB8873632.1 hypothetical protein [Acidisoma silvae]
MDYVFDTETGVSESDRIEAFAGDYLIGTTSVSKGRGAKAVPSAQISLRDLPVMEFPTEIRSLLARTGQEIAATVPLRDKAALLQSVGAPTVKVDLTSVSDRAVSFDLTIETLPEYARECTLYVNGAETGTAVSKPRPFVGHPSAITHEIAFPLRALLRDGAYVEITDIATGTGIYASSITWMNIMGPVLTDLKRLQARYDELSSFFERAQSRMDTIANISRDKQLLDRLDMFYFLINDRLDREVKFLAGKIDPALAQQMTAERAAAVEEDIARRTAHDIDGVGFYEVESDGRAFWRWFGPDVTLFLKDVNPTARALRLQFGAVGSGVRFDDASGSLNGFPIQAEFSTAPEGYSEITFPIAPGSVRSDRAIILNLTFKQAYRAPGDARALSAAFVAAQIFFS